VQEPILANAKFSKVKDPMLCNDLLEMERKMISKNYKFGILYVKQGQTKENEMFANGTLPSSLARIAARHMACASHSLGWVGRRAAWSPPQSSTLTRSRSSSTSWATESSCGTGRVSEAGSM
jgi:hypothetical protein